jgi:hypothetical protein
MEINWDKGGMPLAIIDGQSGLATDIEGRSG